MGDLPRHMKELPMPGVARLLLGMLLIVLAGAPVAGQDAYPARLVKIIIPFPPGSTLDAFTRVMADQMAQKWRQSVVVENISGGGGNIGTERVMRSPPD